MSRSRRKTRMSGGTTAPSEKEDKKKWHKIFRQKNKNLLKKTDSEETVFTTVNEVSNPFHMAKDGKGFIYHEKFMRK